MGLLISMINVHTLRAIFQIKFFTYSTDFKITDTLDEGLYILQPKFTENMEKILAPIMLLFPLKMDKTLPAFVTHRRFYTWFLILYWFKWSSLRTLQFNRLNMQLIGEILWSHIFTLLAHNWLKPELLSFISWFDQCSSSGAKYLQPSQVKHQTTLTSWLKHKCRISKDSHPELSAFSSPKL